MSELLQLRLLGSPRVLLNDQPLTSFVHNKAQALLFYLAVTGQTHSRAAVATLLWNEMTEAQAQKNLRTVLPELRRLVGHHLVIERQTVAFQRASPYWLDVEALRQRAQLPFAPIDLTARQAAVALYQGEFLQGFYVHHAPAFEGWVLEQREQLHTLVTNALTGLVNAYVQADNQASALAANRQLLVLEPWSESAHRQQIFLLAQTGERAAALAQYETCRRVLAAEFGIEPLPETKALYEQIRGGETRRQGDRERSQSSVSAPVLSHKREPQAPLPLDRQTAAERQPNAAGAMTAALPRLPVAGHNFPLQTKLYGRQAELASLHKWLIEDSCRLVSIFGIGGQGKTTLAAALVRGLIEPASPPNRLGGTGTATISPLPIRGQNEASAFTRIIWQPLINAPPWPKSCRSGSMCSRTKR